MTAYTQTTATHIASIDATKPIGVLSDVKPNCAVSSAMSGSSAMKSTNAFVIAPRTNPNARSPSAPPDQTAEPLSPGEPERAAQQAEARGGGARVADDAFVGVAAAGRARPRRRTGSAV